MRDRQGWLTLSALLFLTLLAPLPAAQRKSEQEQNAADARRLVEVLDLHPGSVVADIGAGGGELSILVAPAVAPAGRVYATDLGGAPLERLRRALAKAGAKNVEVVEGHALRTNLPPGCCDAIFIRNVYHHFGDPAAMDTSLRESLKPGAKLAIMDFAPDGPEAATPADRASDKTHGVSMDSVARELREAGFEITLTERGHDRTFLVVARKPEV